MENKELNFIGIEEVPTIPNMIKNCEAFTKRENEYNLTTAASSIMFSFTSKVEMDFEQKELLNSWNKQLSSGKRKSNHLKIIIRKKIKEKAKLEGIITGRNKDDKRK